MRSREQVLRDAKAGRLDAGDPRPSRRTFIQLSAAGGGGLLIAWGWRPSVRAQGAAAPAATGFQPHAYIRVAADDVVTVWCAQPDMGEGTRTSLPMLLVEELDADWERIRIEHAPLDARYGGQGVGGSDAIRYDWDRLRQFGAVARRVLVQAAAGLWSVDESACETERGVVHHRASGRSARYGDLAGRAAALPVPASATTKDPSRYRLIGTPVGNVDAPAIVRGQPLFGIDVRLPGMLFASIAKAPVFGGRPLTVDAHAAMAVPGVRQIVQVHGLDNPTHLMSGVAVVADSTWAAFKGRDALRVEWSEGEFATESGETLATQARELLDKPPLVVHETGAVDEAFANASVQVDNVYTAAFVAHAPMEPHNCTADYRNGEVWIRGPLQMPASGRQVVARALGIAPARVHVQSTRIGGGFGRRLMNDYAAEAAVVSRAVGRPIQVIDSREGDLQHDYYRPMSVQRLRAGLDAAGRLSVWDHTIVSASRSNYRREPRPAYSTETYGAYVGRVTSPDYSDLDLAPARIPHARLRYSALSTGVPTGAWRAPSHVVNTFAIETTLDELAMRAKVNAIDLRLQLLGEPGDLP